ncbi:hypothetical protein ACKWTF_003370 [Chironomus riparius]
MKILTATSILVTLFISNIKFCTSDGFLEFISIEAPTSTNKSMVIYSFENKKNKIYFKAEIIRPLNHVMLAVNLFVQEGLKFRELFKSKEYDWCRIISRKAKSNPLFRTFFEPLSKKVPAISKCPLQGTIEFDLTFERKKVMIFPNGIYKIAAHASRKDDDDVITTSLVLKINN